MSTAVFFELPCLLFTDTSACMLVFNVCGLSRYACLRHASIAYLSSSTRSFDYATVHSGRWPNAVCHLEEGNTLHVCASL